MHLAVDLDDTCLTFMGSVIEKFEGEYGVKVPYDDVPWGEQAVKFGEHPLFAESGYEGWWDWLRDRDWLWATFPAIDGAIGGIKRLREAGHYIEAVTSKPVWAEHLVWQWVGKWRPAFNRVTIITNGMSKLDYTDAEVIVDDKLATCREFAEAGRTGIIFDRAGAYSNEPAGRRLLQARDWNDVVFLVERVNERSQRG